MKRAQYGSPLGPDAAEVGIVAVHYKVLDSFLGEVWQVAKGCVDW